MKHPNKRLAVGCGGVLCGLFCAQAQEMAALPPTSAVPALLETASATPISPIGGSSFLPSVQIDPLAYLHKARRDYDHSVRDYSCRLTKQELLGKKLSKEQVVEVKFREGPFSVFMHITKNPDQARRVLYVKDKFVKDGAEQAVVEPEGPIARLLVRSVLRPIDGRDAQKVSRRLISEFGFARSLDLVIKYAELAQAQGRLDLRYAGEGMIDGRRTHVLERRLPYDSASREWPDALVVVHMDQEWNLPVACYSYADPDGKQLLGKYEYSNVRLNIGLPQTDFEPATHGL